MSSEADIDKLGLQIVQLLKEEGLSTKKAVSFEVQDDGQCIIFFIPVDDVTSSELQGRTERVCQLLNDRVPGRLGDYSWFATFTVENIRVDSCFGGNLDFPNIIF